ncbi:MAG: DUF3108 domain-containing protein [Hyphomicrobiaceae bacterium]
MTTTNCSVLDQLKANGRRVSLGTLVAALLLATPAYAETPARVAGAYDITFNGVSLGNLRITTELADNRYQTAATAKFSALFGALKWSGRLEGRGAVTSLGPSPTQYAHAFESERNMVVRNRKSSQEVRLGFRDGAVVDRFTEPKLKTQNRVPITPAHLRDVLDPTAAVVAITQVGAGQSPCDRDIPVFNGRTRFDLIFKPKSRDGRLHTCSVHYRPVAGHRIDDGENNDLASRLDIFVVLEMVDGLEIAVPREISVPMSAGTVRIAASSLEIVTSRQRRIALAAAR